MLYHITRLLSAHTTGGLTIIWNVLRDFKIYYNLFWQQIKDDYINAYIKDNYINIVWIFVSFGVSGRKEVTQVTDVSDYTHTLTTLLQPEILLYPPKATDSQNCDTILNSWRRSSETLLGSTTALAHFRSLSPSDRLSFMTQVLPQVWNSEI